MERIISRSVRRYPGGTRRADMYRHLARGWVPPQPGLLEAIQQRLSEDDSVCGLDLLEEVQSDFSILAHSLRSLREVAREKLWEKDPMEIFSELNREQLQSIFDTSEAKLSLHKFKRMGKFQQEQFAHSITSLSGVEVLRAQAEGSGHSLSPSRLNACGSLRQLVPNLIAWNYPRLFPKVLQATRRGEGSLEENINRILGDSPRTLAAAFASEWQLRPQLLQAIRYSRTEQNPNLPWRIDYSDNNSAEAIGAICEMAEGLAKLQNPRQFPGAEREWTENVPEIERMLGSDKTSSLVKDLEEQAGERLEKYSSALGSSLFRERVHGHRRIVKVRQSSDFEQCEPALQASLTSFYEILQGSPIEGLHWLINQTIPAAGFRSGCIFLSSSTGDELRPSIFLGGDAKKIFTRRDPYISKILASSVFRELPFSEAGSLRSNYQLHHVSAALGGEVELGVLVLEVAKTEESEYLPGGISHFKAVREALLESLRCLRKQESSAA